MIYRCFDKKSSGGAIKNQIKSHQRLSDLAMRQLAKELNKSIITKFKKEKYIHFLKAIIGLLILQICDQ